MSKPNTNKSSIHKPVVSDVRKETVRRIQQSVDALNKTIWVRGPSKVPFTDDFIQLEQLGNAGQYGVTYRCKRKSDGQSFAVKYINKNRFYRIEKKSRHKYLRLMNNEISILETLNHPNIITLHNIYEDKSKLYIVMEECKGGTLFDRILKRKRYSERDAAIVMKQLLEAIQYMHEENEIVHCDLKPDNILFLDDSAYSLKIIDFGMSQVLPRLKYLTDICGTPYYTAPEVVKKNKYNHSCDVWSIGVILYTMIFGYPPFYIDPDKCKKFGIKENKAIYSKIMKGFDANVKSTDKYGFGAWFPDHIRSSDAVRHLIGNLLMTKVRKRYTVSEALLHPWIVKHCGGDRQLSDSKEDDDDVGLLDKLVVSRLIRFNNVCQFKLVIVRMFRAQYYKMRPEHFAQLEVVFNRFDLDNDGVLSFSEFERALQSVKSDGINLEKTQMMQLYSQLNNEDKTKGIQFSDLLNALVHDYLVSCDERLYDAFRKLDDDDDGLITVDQLEKKLKDLNPLGEWDRAIQIMKNECFNENGVIDYEEFLLNLHPTYNSTPDWMPPVLKEMMSIQTCKEIEKMKEKKRRKSKERLILNSRV